MNWSLLPWAAVLAIVALRLLRMRREAWARNRWPDGPAVGGAMGHRRSLFLVIAGVAGAVAAQVPAVDRDRLDVYGQTPAVVFVIDLSRSMQVDDVGPSRLGAAVQLAEGVAGDPVSRRLGVVLFAGEAVLACPVTTDRGAFRLALGEVAAAYDSLRGGSDLAGALDRAVAALPAEGGTVVLLSDGESADEGLAAVLDRAAARHITVHAVGLGTVEGRSMRVAREGSAGPDRVTRLHEERLQRVASSTGGHYLRWSPMDEPPPLEQWLPMSAPRSGGQPITPWWQEAALMLLVASLVAEWASQGRPE